MPIGTGQLGVGVTNTKDPYQSRLTDAQLNYNIPLGGGRLNAGVNRNLPSKQNQVNLQYVHPFKKGGKVHMAGGGLSKGLLKAEMTNLNENSKNSTMDAFLNLVPDITSRYAPALAATLYTPNLNSGEDAELAMRRTMPANIDSPIGFDPRGDMGLGKPTFNKGGKVHMSNNPDSQWAELQFKRK
jgi:hypothetical protein